MNGPGLPEVDDHVLEAHRVPAQRAQGRPRPDPATAWPASDRQQVLTVVLTYPLQFFPAMVALEDKLGLSDEEIAKWKLAVVSFGRVEYLGEHEVVKQRFRKHDNYGNWDDYLGLEHAQVPGSGRKKAARTPSAAPPFRLRVTKVAVAWVGFRRGGERDGAATRQEKEARRCGDRARRGRTGVRAR